MKWSYFVLSLVSLVSQNSLLVKNYENRLIPKKFSIKVYKNLSGPEGINFLTELDSMILDKKLDKSVEFVIDKFEYGKILLNIEDQMRKKSIEKIDLGIEHDKISKRMSEQIGRAHV